MKIMPTPTKQGLLDVISGLMQIETLSTREVLGFLRVDREQDNLTMVAAVPRGIFESRIAG
jgi:hypothetical protein